MLKIALTGNIASGKTEVEKYLINRGFKILCLDKVTKELYETDDDLKSKLIEAFGTCQKDEISKFIFKSKDKIKTLESIIYPKIKDRMFDFINKNNNDRFIIISAAMLFESSFNKYFDKIIFISSNEDIRLKRLIKRNNLSKTEAILRITSQKKEDSKILNADFIIKNNSTLNELYSECERVIEELNTL